jgi:hypothetical protein
MRQRHYSRLLGLAAADMDFHSRPAVAGRLGEAVIVIEGQMRHVVVLGDEVVEMWEAAAGRTKDAAYLKYCKCRERGNQKGLQSEAEVGGPLAHSGICVREINGPLGK